MVPVKLQKSEKFLGDAPTTLRNTKTYQFQSIPIKRGEPNRGSQNASDVQMVSLLIYHCLIWLEKTRDGNTNSPDINASSVESEGGGGGREWVEIIELRRERKIEGDPFWSLYQTCPLDKL